MEPRAVHAKSDLFGTGRVALPVVFARGQAGWHAKWMRLNLTARPRFNRVEANRRSTSLLVRAIVERRYLTVANLEGLLRRNGAPVERWPVALDPAEKPVTHVGLDRAQDLPAGSHVYTPANLTAPRCGLVAGAARRYVGAA